MYSALASFLQFLSLSLTHTESHFVFSSILFVCGENVYYAHSPHKWFVCVLSKTRFYHFHFYCVEFQISINAQAEIDIKCTLSSKVGRMLDVLSSNLDVIFQAKPETVIRFSIWVVGEWLTYRAIKPPHSFLLHKWMIRLQFLITWAVCVRDMFSLFAIHSLIQYFFVSFDSARRNVWGKECMMTMHKCVRIYSTKDQKCIFKDALKNFVNPQKTSTYSIRTHKPFVNFMALRVSVRLPFIRFISNECGRIFSVCLAMF